MKIDVEDAENEPIPAPIDNCVSRLPPSKIKYRMPPPTVTMTNFRIKRKHTSNSRKQWVNISPISRRHGLIDVRKSGGSSHDLHIHDH